MSLADELLADFDEAGDDVGDHEETMKVTVKLWNWQK